MINPKAAHAPTGQPGPRPPAPDPASEARPGPQSGPRPPAPDPASEASPTRVRYYVLWLSFVVAFVMYLDRACMGTATPSIMREFGLDKIAMGWSTSAFNWTYALFQVPGGWLADRFGSRLVLAAAIAWWSAFTAATARSFARRPSCALPGTERRWRAMCSAVSWSRAVSIR